MEKNRWYLRLAALVLLFGVLSMTASLAVEAGSRDDPLVTLSYLNGTFLEEVLRRFDEKLAASGSASSGGEFTVVTLSQGEVLRGEIGCEVLLRVGSAACVADSAPGLVDETSAGTIENGASLVQNHMYIMTIEGRGVRAESGTVKLLARGGWKVA